MNNFTRSRCALAIIVVVVLLAIWFGCVPFASGVAVGVVTTVAAMSLTGRDGARSGGHQKPSGTFSRLFGIRSTRWNTLNLQSIGNTDLVVRYWRDLIYAKLSRAGATVPWIMGKQPYRVTAPERERLLFDVDLRIFGVRSKPSKPYRDRGEWVADHHEKNRLRDILFRQWRTLARAVQGSMAASPNHKHDAAAVLAIPDPQEKRNLQLALDHVWCGMLGSVIASNGEVFDATGSFVATIDDLNEQLAALSAARKTGTAAAKRLIAATRIEELAGIAGTKSILETIDATQPQFDALQSRIREHRALVDEAVPEMVLMFRTKILQNHRDELWRQYLLYEETCSRINEMMTAIEELDRDKARAEFHLNARAVPTSISAIGEWRLAALDVKIEQMKKVVGSMSSPRKMVSLPTTTTGQVIRTPTAM